MKYNGKRLNKETVSLLVLVNKDLIDLNLTVW